MHQQQKINKTKIMFIGLFIISCFFFSVSDIYSIDRKEKSCFSQSFFPLQAGNKWIFQRQELASYNTYFTLSIIDTTHYDNELYWEFSPFLFFGKQYYRIDSTGNFMQLNNQKPILNFYMQVGDSIQIGYYPEYSDSGYTYCVKRESVTTLIGTPGEQIHYFIDWYSRVIDEADEIILQEGVGPVGLSFSEHDSPMILRGAVIKSIVYGDTTTTSVKYEALESMNDYHLFQNYPNPFNSNTSLKYQLPEATEVKLEIYNLLGQRIRTLVDQFQNTGSYSINWDGTDDFHHPVASGVYLYQLKTKSFIKAKKLIVLR